MSNRPDHLASFTATDDALVLASVGSAAERELLNNWLQQQRKDHPDTKVEALELPGEDPPPECSRNSSNSSAPTRTGP